ncbi:MAG: hypothetical protein LIO91_03670 [Bacteroidales bacterium]|nr:hypothetical protein [Bacteroidales bacterium]
MVRYFYSADWHKMFKTEDGQLSSDTIDSASIDGWSLKQVVARSKTKLLALYNDPKRWAKELERNNAVDLDITIHEYEVDTDRGIWDGSYLSIDKAWAEFDPQWSDMVGSVAIRKGKPVFIKDIYNYMEE